MFWLLVLPFLLLAILLILYRYLKDDHGRLYEDRSAPESASALDFALLPHIEEILWETLSDIERRVARFGFDVTVAFSGDDDGYIASSPQIKGCSAFGSTIEEAVHEFAVALQLYTKTMLEDGEIFA